MLHYISPCVLSFLCLCKLIPPIHCAQLNWKLKIQNWWILQVFCVVWLETVYFVTWYIENLKNIEAWFLIILSKLPCITLRSSGNYSYNTSSVDIHTWSFKTILTPGVGAEINPRTTQVYRVFGGTFHWVSATTWCRFPLAIHKV